MNGFRETASLTNGGTNGRDSLGLKRLPQETKNLHFWEFWSKMANFGQFLAKMGETGFFSKKHLEHFSAFTSPN